ncbi:Swt1 family HEPN domain-containing protein [Sphingomonas sp. NCPPB 2930]
MTDSIRRHLDELHKQQDLLDPANKLKAILGPSTTLQQVLMADQRITDILKTELQHQSTLESVLGTGLRDYQLSTHGLADHSAAYLANMSTKSSFIDWMGPTNDTGSSIRDLAVLRPDIDSVLRQSGMSEVQRLALGINSRDMATDIGRSIESLTSARAAYQQAFRLPQLGEIEQLARGLDQRNTVISSAAVGSSFIQQAMEQMHSPWLHNINSAASAGGFADLIRIGRGIQQRRPFDEALSSSLRTTLGDWREDLTQSVALADPVLRADFYRDRGFDPEVVNFPAMAFEEGLQIAGFQVWQEIEIVDEADDGTTHAAMAFRALRSLETAIRRFIVERLVALCGDKWYRQRLPSDMLQTWKEKKAKDTTSGSDLPLIEYADFSDYIKIIVRQDNWSAVFQAVFVRKEDVQESFRRLGPIRISTMHARLVLKEDLLLMASESTRILKAIKGAAPLS